MILIDSIRNLFLPGLTREVEHIVPAPPGTYEIKPLTSNHLAEVLRLNIRCFRNGDNYTRHTFDYLLNLPNTLSYRAVNENGDMVGFAFVIVNENGSAHLTTIGIAPEHRARGLAKRLLGHVEGALIKREINTLMLEVRVGNAVAQDLYHKAGYYAVQRLNRYYNDGEDCFMMVKGLA